MPPLPRALILRRAHFVKPSMAVFDLLRLIWRSDTAGLRDVIRERDDLLRDLRHLFARRDSRLFFFCKIDLMLVDRSACGLAQRCNDNAQRRLMPIRERHRNIIDILQRSPKRRQRLIDETIAVTVASDVFRMHRDFWLSVAIVVADCNEPFFAFRLHHAAFRSSMTFSRPGPISLSAVSPPV
ncbi:MAG: hypothetical protein J0H17_10385 [Rhizobiales bacterium]|nr:hypothetical protein [Hyphomicrobiales bacterium]